MITAADIAEFQQLYQKHFGQAIDNEEAQKKLVMLVRQMEIIYQPITKRQFAELTNEYEVDNESERSGRTR